MAEERISQGITTEKELELNLSTESHKPWITAIGKALSSAVRIDILNLIKVHPLSLQEISRTGNPVIFNSAAYPLSGGCSSGIYRKPAGNSWLHESLHVRFYFVSSGSV